MERSCDVLVICIRRFGIQSIDSIMHFCWLYELPSLPVAVRQLVLANEILDYIERIDLC